ncbi:MAG: hypothetical protein LC754_02920 [Acidobacteria bacterium]|nr:hypothetical protein [Acidobacteriota bacterium]
MNEESTKDMDGNRSFEERVFARFDALDARLDSFETRLQALEEQAERRAMETKPIWERALDEIMATRRELTEMRREVTKRLDRIEAVLYETRSNLPDAEDRIEKLESESTR